MKKLGNTGLDVGTLTARRISKNGAISRKMPAVHESVTRRE
jgi:hypothetical protein